MANEQAQMALIDEEVSALELKIHRYTEERTRMRRGLLRPNEGPKKTEEAADAAGAETPETEEKPMPKRRARKKKEAEPEAEGDAPEADEKPKRRRSPKKADAEKETKEAAAEEKPKRRTRKKKDEEAEAEKGSAEEKPADTEADDKPKKKGWWSR